MEIMSGEDSLAALAAVGLWIRPAFPLLAAVGLWIRPAFSLLAAVGLWIRPAFSLLAVVGVSPARPFLPARLFVM
jgi:hypothetical protein